MVVIPQQLNIEGLRFINLSHQKAKGKKSIRPGSNTRQWSENNNMDYDQMSEWLKNNPEYNYGVLGGKGGLIILDYDDYLFQELYSKKLPKTFTVKSAGKGLKHCYYFINEDCPIRRIQIKLSEKHEGKNTYSLLDVQGDKSYVAGAGSIRSDGEYTVMHDLPINLVTMDELKQALGKWWDKSYTKPVEVRKPVVHNADRYNCWDILKNLGLTFIVKSRRNAGDTVWYNGACPICGISDGNPHNFGITEDGNGFECFHSKTHGNAVELIKHLTGCNTHGAFKQIKQWRMEENE